MRPEKETPRGKLRLKPVGLEYLDQFNELLRYVFQVTNQEIAESGYRDGELIQAKRPVLQNADVIGWFNEDDELVSQLAVYPCRVNVHGRIYSMAGVTGVGTYPEYTSLGLMRELIRTGLEHMRERGQWIAYLHPYSIPYYREKGWEIMSDHLTFNIRDSQLPRVADVDGYVERLAAGDPDVIAVYDQFARITHGAMIREPLNWDEYWRWENEDERTAGVYYGHDGRPLGYVLYWIADEVFRIKEMIYLNQEARKGLWNFISAHFSMINSVHGNIYRNEPVAFLLEDGEIEETVSPYIMGRIVDVEAFLRDYPFPRDPAEPFHFVVEDPLAEWNNGVFSVQWDDLGQTMVGREPLGRPVKANIQTLTALLMSYRSPSYLHRIERLEADEATIKMLEYLIPDQEPYFSDYF
ncbi:MAG: GNAT family N-acetyltransferase [Xanthomonadaceae bacterium]|jgi:predicted acetyltransferase|nr:GNAT family N-acetyltransferase [Xanthomonadaceae bacterium]